jgi:tetratricopeptide (TPR) repeat protein
MKTILASLLVFAAWAAQAKDFQPTSDAQVLERLPSRTVALSAKPTGAQAPDAASAAQAAQRAIQLAREQGDPRYLGRAQALLQPWWSKEDASATMALLQASIEQSLHEFNAARASLRRALAREPRNAQAWLILASLERLGGQYAKAGRACEQVANAGQNFYAMACQAELDSLTGQHAKAHQTLSTLASQAPSKADAAWLHSLLAESQERAGQDAPALRSYQQSLSWAEDLYTRIALADLLLRTGANQAVLDSLQTAPHTDSVLLRRAAALKALQKPEWKSLHAELAKRFKELAERGENLQLHARELAQMALWLGDDPRAALTHALSNLELQKEPLDWRIAIEAVSRARDTQQMSHLLRSIKSTGLQDARLRVPTTTRLKSSA